jgi:putative transposase
MIEGGPLDLSVRRQCVLLGLNRASLYDVPAQESAENLTLMRVIDDHYTPPPFSGSRRMTADRQRQGDAVNRQRVQRLMPTRGREAI